MKLYELINPSDPYLFEAPDLEIAAVVSIILGEGKTPVEEVDSGNLVVPFFMLGENEDWTEKTFGKTMEEFLHYIHTERKEDLATALESVIVGNLENREEFFETVAMIDDPKKKEEYKKKYIKRNTSSLNDIGAYAAKFAKMLREEE